MLEPVVKWAGKTDEIKILTHIQQTSIENLAKVAATLLMAKAMFDFFLIWAATELYFKVSNLILGGKCTIKGRSCRNLQNPTDFGLLL
jgi:hypothetical protein